jgi:carbonic anhydrase/acetyltransferase-like protein (isoleucine patch superfamily)
MQPRVRRHRNGGGAVEDFVEISRRVRVEDSSVLELAEVTGSGKILAQSRIAGNAIVTDSPHIEASDILGYSIVTGSPFISKSSIDEHALITGTPRIIESAVRGTARVKDEAVVSGSVVDGNASVSGKAIVNDSHLHGHVFVTGGELHGVSLERTERVHEGVWYRAPNHKAHPSVPMAMTECVDNKVIIGCLCRSVHWWKENATKMQEEYGWTDEAVSWVWANIDSMHLVAGGT